MNWPLPSIQQTWYSQQPNLLHCTLAQFGPLPTPCITSQWWWTQFPLPTVCCRISDITYLIVRSHQTTLKNRSWQQSKLLLQSSNPWSIDAHLYLHTWITMSRFIKIYSWWNAPGYLLVVVLETKLNSDPLWSITSIKVQGGLWGIFVHRQLLFCQGPVLWCTEGCMVYGKVYL